MTLNCAASAAAGNSPSVLGQGELGPLRDVSTSDTIQHNCISISQLSDNGINVIFTPSGVTVANGVTFVCCRREGGLYKLSLQDILSLSSGPVLNIRSQNPDSADTSADTSHRAIREALQFVEYWKSYRCSCGI